MVIVLISEQRVRTTWMTNVKTQLHAVKSGKERQTLYGIACMWNL